MKTNLRKEDIQHFVCIWRRENTASVFAWEGLCLFIAFPQKRSEDDVWIRKTFIIHLFPILPICRRDVTMEREERLRSGSHEGEQCSPLVMDDAVRLRSPYYLSLSCLIPPSPQLLIEGWKMKHQYIGKLSVGIESCLLTCNNISLRANVTRKMRILVMLFGG